MKGGDSFWWSKFKIDQKRGPLNRGSQSLAGMLELALSRRELLLLALLAKLVASWHNFLVKLAVEVQNDKKRRRGAASKMTRYLRLTH